MKRDTIKQFARNLRANPTPAEKVFWEKVRRKSFHGFKFYRQYPMKYKLSSNHHRYFIADFYCHHKKLIIEIDGSIHKTQKEYDIDRSDILTSMGYRIVRFENESFIFNWDQVEKTLLEIFNH